jgi:signal transduction histidine kinase
MSSMFRARWWQTVTARLTLWYLGMLAAGALGVFLTVQWVLVSYLDWRNEEQIESEMIEFANYDFALELDQMLDDITREAAARGTHRVFYALWNRDGEMLGSSELRNWRWLDLFPPEVQRLPAGQEYWNRVRLPRGRHEVLLCYRRLPEGYVMGIGHSLRSDKRLLRHYGIAFGLASGLLLVVAGILGWQLARRAMAGVVRVTETAQGIGGGGLSRRVPQEAHEGLEIEELAKAFNGMLDRIERLVVELTQVTNNIAHDLRGPLTRLRSTAERSLTGDQGRAEAQADLPGLAIEECDRLVGLINTMLEIARTDAGLAQLQRQRCDVRALTAAAFELFAPVMEDHGQRPELTLDDAPVEVWGDVQRLQRALANVLDNACKYTPAGGAIHVGVRAAADGGAVITVQDEGPGIAEADLPRIFERFYRADASRTTPGSGLGLTLARAYVIAHGGDIEVASTVGEGATFTLRLPPGGP